MILISATSRAIPAGEPPTCPYGIDPRRLVQALEKPDANAVLRQTRIDLPLSPYQSAFVTTAEHEFVLPSRSVEVALNSIYGSRMRLSSGGGKWRIFSEGLEELQTKT
jgi:hypothetical protein